MVHLNWIGTQESKAGGMECRMTSIWMATEVMEMRGLSQEKHIKNEAWVDKNQHRRCWDAMLRSWTRIKTSWETRKGRVSRKRVAGTINIFTGSDTVQDTFLFQKSAASAQGFRVLTCKIACGSQLTMSSVCTNTYITLPCQCSSDFKVDMNHC